MRMSPAVRCGVLPDETTAIDKAAAEFKEPANRLMAERARVDPNKRMGGALERDGDLS